MQAWVVSIHEVNNILPEDTKILNGKILLKTTTATHTNSLKISFQQNCDAKKGKAMACKWSVTAIFWNLSNFYLRKYLLNLNVAIL